MAVMLALSAAVVFGSADFLGGLASRRRAVLAVALVSQVAGLLALAVVLPLLGSADVAPRDLGLGALGGLFGATGVVLLFGALARGPMSVVAPVAALTASILPVLAGLLLGERPDPTGLLGIVIAVGAVYLITREPGAPGVSDRPGALRVAGIALLAGSLFGLFFVCLHGTSDSAGLYPLLGARMASIPFLALLLVHRGIDPRSALEGRGLPMVVACGVLDMAANVLYLLALRHGMLAVVSALTGLYPASTVLLAQRVLDERMRPSQFAGLGVAALAAVLVAV